MEIKVVKPKFSMLNNAYISLLIIDGALDLSSSAYLMQRLDQGHPLKTQARHATSRNSGTPVALIRSPTQRMGDALNAMRP